MNIGELTATLGIDDSQLLTAQQSMQRYGAVVESRLKSTERGINRHIGLIKDIEEALTELRDERKDAFSVEEIEKYNRKIAEAEQHLKEYKEAGIPAERQTDNLGSSFKQLAIKAIAAVAIWKTFKAVMESTSITATWFHSTIEGARTGLDYFMKSIALADFSGFTAGLREAIRAGRDFTYAMEELGNVSREYAIREVILQGKIEEQRRIMYASDKTSFAAKIKAGETILGLIKEQANMEIELATSTYQIVAAKTAAKNKLTEDQIKYAIENYSKISSAEVKEYQALEAIMGYVNKQIEKGMTVRNDVIEAQSKQWVVLNGYTIKSIEDLEKAMEGLPTAKFMTELGRMAEEEKDVITNAIIAVELANQQFLRESFTNFNVLENLRDASFKKQIKSYENFWTEIAWIRKKNEQLEAPKLVTPISKMPEFGTKGWFAMTDITLMQQVSAELANIAMRNTMFGDTADTTAQQVAWLEKKLNDLFADPDNWGTPDMDALIERYIELKGVSEEAAIAIIQANDMLLAKMEIMRALADFGGVLVDRQIAKLDEQYKKDMEGAKNNANQKIKIEEEYHKKRNALIRRAAIIEKAAGLFSVLINTAKGVMAAASNPLTLPLIPWIKALGIIQAVAIAAAPLPGLAEGGIIPPGYPNDSYPAMLTSGERVTPPGKLDHQSSRLKVDSIEIDMHTLRIALSQTEAEYLETT